MLTKASRRSTPCVGLTPTYLLISYLSYLHATPSLSFTIKGHYIRLCLLAPTPSPWELSRRLLYSFFLVAYLRLAASTDGQILYRTLRKITLVLCICVVCFKINHHSYIFLHILSAICLSKFIQYAC